MAYSEPKGRPRKIACQETGDRAQASGAVRREIRVIRRKSHYLNPSLQKAKGTTRRKDARQPVPAPAAG